MEVVDEREEHFIDFAILELLVQNDSTISVLLNLRDSSSSSPANDQVNRLLLELRFISLYTMYMAKLNEQLKDLNNTHLEKSKLLFIKSTLKGAIMGFHSIAAFKILQTKDRHSWENLASEILEEFQLCKPKVYECLNFLMGCLHLKHPLDYKFCSFQLQKFYSCLLDFLDDLVRLKGETISDLNLEIQDMKGRLQLLMQIYEFNRSKDSSNKDVKDFNLLIQTWLHNAACLSLMYWINVEGITDMEKKVILITPRITSMFLTALKCLWSSSVNRLLMHEDVVEFADFFLEMIQIFPFKDDIAALKSGLIFWTTFLIDPPWGKNAFVPVESLSCSINTDELKGFFVEKSSDLDNTSLEKMNSVIVEVRKLYARFFQDLSSFSFPETNLWGFLDSLSGNSEGSSKCSRNNEVVRVRKELESLRPFLGKFLELQGENLWTRIVNVVYRAKIGIQLLANSSYCYDVKCLSDITEDIKLLKSEINIIQDQEISNTKMPVPEKYTSPARAYNFSMVEEFVGFEDESETITHHLIAGSSALNIIAIVGMAGQGKTTLAKKIYDSHPVQKHFDMLAWCCVSQAYQTKRLFLDILSSTVPTVDFSSKTEEELEEHLRRCLLGQKYLIVIDDIWDITAWNALKMSFPVQENGSRTLFTTRIQDLALRAKPDCILHGLRKLNLCESLELLTKKLFRNKEVYPYLMGVSNQIAKNCNGLPLAIVVIAGILSEKLDDLNWWNHIAESIHSHANDGCTYWLELSYKHLPEYLKQCFLYFGAFPEDSVIRVRKLIQLWISEGFVHKPEVENMEAVAKDYLMDLVSRSLVVVAQRSSTGSIKACQIHDLLHAFCIEKGKKENFLQVAVPGEACHKSAGEVYKNYRLCFQSIKDGFELCSSPCLHSLRFLATRYYSTSFDTIHFLFICNFKLLHVLDMEDFLFTGRFLEEVVLLVHLKYFAMYYGGHEKHLSIPSSLSNLRNLETFRLRGNVTIHLPNEIWRMKRLRHIDATLIIPISGEDELQESPALDNIKTFSTQLFLNAEAAEELLRRISNARKLKCVADDYCKACNKVPLTSSISHLTHELITCRCGSFELCNQFPKLDFLSQLESLNVKYAGPPCALSIPPTLKKLTLVSFSLQRSQVLTIAKLPQLEVLKLRFCYLEKIWDLDDDEFPKLKFLKLYNSWMKGWNIISDNPFPCLEQLIIYDCIKLNEIPRLFGEITTLKRIEVDGKNPAIILSARRIEEEFEEVQVIVSK